MMIFNEINFFNQAVIFDMLLLTYILANSIIINIYIIASTQIKNTEIFAFIAVLISTLLSRKVLFMNRKDSRKR